MTPEQIQNLAEELYPIEDMFVGPVQQEKYNDIVYHRRKRFIEGYTTCQQTEVDPARQQTLNQCIEILMKQLQPVVYENGYPIEAVPKTALLELPAMMKLKANQADMVEALQKELDRVKGLLKSQRETYLKYREPFYTASHIENLWIAYKQQNNL